MTTKERQQKASALLSLVGPELNHILGSNGFRFLLIVVDGEAEPGDKRVATGFLSSLADPAWARGLLRSILAWWGTDPGAGLDWQPEMKS